MSAIATCQGWGWLGVLMIAVGAVLIGVLIGRTGR